MQTRAGCSGCLGPAWRLFIDPSWAPWDLANHSHPALEKSTPTWGWGSSSVLTGQVTECANFSHEEKPVWGGACSSGLRMLDRHVKVHMPHQTPPYWSPPRSVILLRMNTGNSILQAKPFKVILIPLKPTFNLSARVVPPPLRIPPSIYLYHHQWVIHTMSSSWSPCLLCWPSLPIHPPTCIPSDLL